MNTLNSQVQCEEAWQAEREMTIFLASVGIQVTEKANEH